MIRKYGKLGIFPAGKRNFLLLFSLKGVITLLYLRCVYENPVLQWSMDSYFDLVKLMYLLRLLGLILGK